MDQWRVSVICFIFSALIALVGCGGGSTYTPDPGPGGGDQLPVGTWEGTAATSAVEDPGIQGLPDIPYDGMAASRVTSEDTTQLELLGSQYLQKYNAEVVGTTLVLNAPTSAPVDGYDIAFGLYKFTGLNEYDLQWLNIECLPAQFGMEYYVALADYTLGDWRWFGPKTIFRCS